MLDQEHQSMISSSWSHAAQLTGQEWVIAAMEHARPSAIYRPSLSVDGNKWCALYGANLQDGVAAFGDTPAEAMSAFDSAWTKQRAVQPSGKPE